MADYSSLIERLEAATAPDAALDNDILEFFGARYAQDWGPEFYWPDGSRFYQHCVTERFDDAIALGKHLFGSPLIGFDNDIPGSETTPRWNAWCYGKDGQHPIGPIALCLAIMRAAEHEGLKAEANDGDK